ncbi:hypothetical protein ACR9YC_03640 [Parasphingorhabdus sp. DH2-15]|uniref:hypothetical protein n=1 Tax=Parasphingorhabdus sp. DH2-15 TaxID=3444112 RepID=UPI003F687038
MTRDLTNRFGPLPIALAGGLILGLLTLTIPNHFIEGAVSTTGISELVSAAAPPLGVKARIAIALATALLVFGVLALILVRDSDNIRFEYSEDDWDGDRAFADLDRQKPAPKKQKLADRLKGFLPVFGDASADDVRELEDLPKLRREDRHPDAPPRAPLMAGRDLSESDDQPKSKPEPVAAQKSTSDEQGTVANVRKRISNLIPRDLIGDTTQSLDEIPLVVKKSPQIAPKEEAAAYVSPPQDLNAPEPVAEPIEDFEDIANVPEPLVEKAIPAVEPEAVDTENSSQNIVFENDDQIEGQVTTQDIPAPQPSVSPEHDADDERELADLSLSELIARLEQGIERLTVSAADAAPITAPAKSATEIEAMVQQVDEPVAQIAKPTDQFAGDGKVQDDIRQNLAIKAVEEAEPSRQATDISEAQPITDPDDMDEALRAALETLRQMTGQQRNAS